MPPLYKILYFFQEVIEQWTSELFKNKFYAFCLTLWGKFLKIYLKQGTCDVFWCTDYYFIDMGLLAFTGIKQWREDRKSGQTGQGEETQ